MENSNNDSSNIDRSLSSEDVRKPLSSSDKVTSGFVTTMKERCMSEKVNSTKFDGMLVSTERSDPTFKNVKMVKRKSMLKDKSIAESNTVKGVMLTRGLSSRRYKEYDIDEIDHKSKTTMGNVDELNSQPSDNQIENLNIESEGIIAPVNQSISSTNSKFPFSYDINQLPTVEGRSENILFEKIRKLRHLVDGSNSNISKGVINNQGVIIKLIKVDRATVGLAIREFESEHAVLMRISHPNIVGYYGRGFIRGANNAPDRQFLVLERLNGGSLLTLLHEKAFTYRQALVIGRDFADALAYLHEEFHPEVTIIHRDLKPDNIVFDDKGKLKLIDFGLSTCVKRRLNSNDTYAMSGETGSLRYMAPEVILCQPYNEKVDIYSFALILWQTTTRLSPYTGLNRNDFTRHVVQEHRRPQLTKRGPGNIILPFELPEKLCDILVACWASDWKDRLSASEVRKRLSALLDETPLSGGTPAICCCL